MDRRMLRSGELGMALWTCVSGQPSVFVDMDVMDCWPMSVWTLLDDVSAWLCARGSISFLDDATMW